MSFSISLSLERSETIGNSGQGEWGVGKEIRENGHNAYESGLLGLSHDGRIVSDVYCI